MNTLRLAAVAAGLALVVAGCSGGTEPDERSSSGDDPAIDPPAADCSPARPADGLTTTPTGQELIIDGAVRRYSIAVPETYDGGSVGGGPTQIPGAVETMAGYLERYGCSGDVSVSEPIPGVRSERSSDCTSGAVVGFDTVMGGTHPWPGGPQAAADPTNSRAGREYDATGAILEFFLAAPPRA